MTIEKQADVQSWLIEPLEPAAQAMVDRLRRAPGVLRIAIMPDVHVATEVCVGTAFVTTHTLYPQAVGGDIGCGMLALAFDQRANRLDDAQVAGRILARLGQRIPTLNRVPRHYVHWPDELNECQLSHPALQAAARDAGRAQLGTLGSGNHFIELQTDESNRLWLMIHSGSRAMGQIIRAFHLANAQNVGSGLKILDARTSVGAAYLSDQLWARRFAEQNRLAMARIVAGILDEEANAAADWSSLISIDHNHVIEEMHDNQLCYVHRKGAMPAGLNVTGLLPGSMGTASFHVSGRGCEASLRSSAHGAGRALSRIKARKNIRIAGLTRAMQGVWYDYRMAGQLREESPAAYKDIHAVLRAQSELVRVIRKLKPRLSFKGR